MKRIYTGWYTNELRLKWTEECRLKLQDGHRSFLFLLPTRHLIQEVRQQLTKDGLGVSGQIGTFDDLVDLGLTKEQGILRIDQQGKLAVLMKAVEMAGEKATAPFRRIMDKPGFLQSLMDALEEMKSSAVSEEMASEWAIGTEAGASANSSAYFRSFAQIYKVYQQLLQTHPAGRLLDRQEGYRVAAGHLNASGEELFAGIDTVYIDFLTVTPLQFPIVEAVCRYVPHVEIFMPYPSDAEGIGTLDKIRERLVKTLAGYGVEHVELRQPETGGFGMLARNLFAENPEKLAISGVEMIPSSTPLQEVKAVAKEIKRLASAGWDPSQIAVVAADDAAYRPLIRRIFQENRIAVRLADIKNLVEVPVVRTILQAVEENPDDFSQRATYTRYAETVRQVVSRLQLVEKLYMLAAADGPYTLEDLRRDVRAWQCCEDALESMVRANRLYGDREVSFAVFWKEWKDLLHESKVQVDGGAGSGVGVYRPAELRGLSFRAVFILGLNEGGYPKKPGDHWLIERLERVAERQGVILQRREQMDLQSLLFRYCIQSAGDRLYLGYQSPEADERNLPSPYLEAVMHCLKEGEWMAPPRFRGAMSHLPVPDRWEDLSSRKEWRERMALWLGGESSLHVTAEPDAWVLEQLEREFAGIDGQSWRQMIDRLAAETERRSGIASSFAGRLADPAIKAILRAKFGAQYPWSVSVLNDYAVCPFKFFAARVLKIQPREEVEDGIPVTEKGVFLHDLAQRLLLPLTGRERVGIDEAQAVMERFEDVFEETCRNWEGSELTANRYWPVERMRLKKELRLWLEHEMNDLVQSRMRPVRLEWSFGSPIREDDRQLPDVQSTEELIAVQAGGESLKLRGRIDRIDLTEDGSGFAVYDYKTSLNPKKYKGIKDLEDGTNWQLPLYLAAYTQWAGLQGNQVVPLGAGFRHVAPLPSKMVGVWGADAGNWGITATRQSDTCEDLKQTISDSLEKVAAQLEELRDGIFDAKPRVECDPYCPYLDVCRYDAAGKERTP
ncbi:PD-(D/E)XK nuclease family protein [Effusibacillus lacus]|nr:PD-(D/E)XK nuclease family protein [Effusibacillus lacus]TCS75527.1 ATP-dependent helicase/DNAse subunit B [Effusibacillus lacus]